MAMLNNEYVIFTLVAIGIFTVYMAAVAILRKDPVRERLKRVVAMDVPGVGFSYEERKSGFATFCENLVTATGTNLSKAKRDLYLKMARAGMMSNHAAAYYLFFQRFVQPLFVILALLFGWKALGAEMQGGPRLIYLILAFILLMVGLFGAKVYVQNRTQKRQIILQKSFSDALDLLLVCVESGLPLDGALARVCRELKIAHPEISGELDRTRIELNVLGDRPQALQNLAERTDTPAFKTLVASLIQAERFGTSIADTLRTLSDEFRTTRMLIAENKAARIPALITLPLILFILPAFMLIIMGPPIIRVNQMGGIFGNASKLN